jgi:adenylate cyclase
VTQILGAVAADGHRAGIHAAAVAALQSTTVRAPKGLVLGLVVGAIGILLRPTTLGVRLEEDLGLPWLFALRGPTAPPPDVAIVSIDRSSAQQLGMDTREWPPPRHVHAAIIRSLNRLDVSTIVMDIWFERERAPEDDKDLALAMAERRNVVLVQRVDRVRVPGADVNTQLLQSPLVEFQRSAVSLAPFPLPRSSLTSFFWPFFETSAGTVPTLPAAALQVHGLPLLTRLTMLLDHVEARHVDELPQQVLSVADSQQLMHVFRRKLSDPLTATRALEQLAPATDGLSTRETAVLAALLKLYAGPDTYYLNFYGSAGQIETIPFHELLLDVDARRNLAGKVVFVGMSPSSLMTSAEQTDTHPTVYSTADGVDLSGAEISATAFANLLTDRTLRPVSSWTAIGALFAFGGLVGFLARVLPGMQAAAVTIALAAAGAALAQFLFTAHARLVPLATPLLVQLPLALFVGLLLRYRDIRRQVPMELDPHAPPEFSSGVCLVTDVVGYSRVAERVTSEELRTLLDEYFRMLQRITKAHRGLTWDRAGDSSQCVWRARKDTPAEMDARLNACLAAIEMRGAIDRFNARLPETHRLNTRIGLNAGPVAVGAIADVPKVYSTTVNVASRIEDLNRHLGTKILASRGVVQGQETIVVRRLGIFILRGQSDEVEIFEILAERRDIIDADRRLCERFAACLEQFEAAHWAGAAECFRGLAGDHPADGPAGYYRDLSVRYVTAPPPDNSLVIHIDSR